ncbi:hypothetical protein CBL_05906 [Carabus blaptoides fortunei]
MQKEVKVFAPVTTGATRRTNGVSDARCSMKRGHELRAGGVPTLHNVITLFKCTCLSGKKNDKRLHNVARKSLLVSDAFNGVYNRIKAHGTLQVPGDRQAFTMKQVK